MPNTPGDVAPTADNARPDQTPPQIEIPDDFQDEQSFMAHIRKELRDDLDFDQANRIQGIEDSEFFAGKQWDDNVRTRRLAKRKPVMTVNRLVAYVGQVVGNRRQNETQIKILPDNGGTKDVAQARQGIIRNAEKVSKASVAYDTALQNCVIAGIGNFGIKLDYAFNDVFDQDIMFTTYPDAFAVVWDRTILDGTGRDAGHVFVMDTVTKDGFKARWPWAVPNEGATDYGFDEARRDGWFAQDDVRVVTYWRMRFRYKNLGLTVARMVDGVQQAGKVVDTDKDPRAVIAKDANGKEIRRRALCPYAEMYLVNGTTLLEGPYRLDISRVPVFRVPAWEVTIGKQKQRFGLIRFMKDPQRLHNYWRSTIAEKLMMTPRARWVASDAAVSGHEKEWREAHMSDDPLLIYNGDSGTPPVYSPAAQLETALIQEANMSSQDMKDVSNLHEASLGQTSNEVSGKAILARQRVGELGTIIYTDNLTAAIAEAGSVADELVPICYDTARTLRILSDDEKESFLRVNDPQDPTAVDITEGKYSVSVTAGPSFTTKRVEAQEAMLAVFNAAPDVMKSAVDLYAETMDWPGSDKFARRLRKIMPPQLLDPEDMDPQELAQFKQQQAQAAQQAQEQAILQHAELKLKMDQIDAETRHTHAQAQAAETAANKNSADVKLILAKAELAMAQKELAIAQALALHVEGEEQQMSDEIHQMIFGEDTPNTVDAAAQSSEIQSADQQDTEASLAPPAPPPAPAAAPTPPQGAQPDA